MNSLENQPPVFEKLVLKALQLKQQIDSTLSALQGDVKSIRKYYESRAEFSRWRQSADGQTWKAEKWSMQKERCAECKCEIPLKGSHIDRIKPLSKFPTLNLTRSNLRITCPECNLRKSDREVDPSSC